MSCQILSQEQQDAARRSGAILGDCLLMINEFIKPGVTTLELDERAEEFIRSKGGVPGFKGYQGFPGTLCTSVNEECVHGIPSERELIDGDIISLDCGVLLDGIYTDACRTYPVGTISSDADKLLKATEGSLKNVLNIVRANVLTGDLSASIQQYAEERGFKPVRSLTGHGLGDNLHQPPDIPNIGTKGTGVPIPNGALIAIEPIISAGSDIVKESSDGWTLVIKNLALSAHFEHSLLVHEDGCEVVA
ncbi:type I methionyl aminopeptidase [Candidatus Peregrinibacteria bacterium]|jgi:methionyl aminopeptidase|nr:type I methionyl aminopeptidase [Candidatus Peregrinibacteria bacterium]MBT3599091.1 type I methionyl aminopeptidase [Candidatus Peregrinibacteria bacterium]MBT4367674.1 type I methionyl aminopeptidase [Candidatus Peregrinibacteria bacterium]MBT4585452.1 type I methionyl aminopeptidase [Candidatus Peregrinibacteria bacterium]MBT6730397.1 type I methionyl aminopeptidase [Candidatus Peregrinibacteria bacterium]